MSPSPPTTRVQLWSQFFGGLLYLAMGAEVLSEATRQRFLPTLIAVVAGVVFCSGLGLLWVTLWAVRKDSRLGQFTIGSLLFLTLFAAIYLGVVRWTAVSIEQNYGQPASDSGLFLGVAAAWLLALIVGARLVVGMTESLVWLAVWIVRRLPSHRRDMGSMPLRMGGWLFGRRGPRDS